MVPCWSRCHAASAYSAVNAVLMWKRYPSLIVDNFVNPKMPPYPTLSSVGQEIVTQFSPSMTHRPLHVIHRACMAVVGLFIFQNPHSARDASLPCGRQTPETNCVSLSRAYLSWRNIWCVLKVKCIPLQDQRANVLLCVVFGCAV